MQLLHKTTRHLREDEKKKTTKNNVCEIQIFHSNIILLKRKRQQFIHSVVFHFPYYTYYEAYSEINPLLVALIVHTPC